ncbi:MAG: hypothetical protein EPO62_06490 [Candidatus Nitrosotenuis sp.]|nr:MAG: hypothetical protein EPO62_06490 [Candidatus Nitrosotenuis sp.]
MGKRVLTSDGKVIDLDKGTGIEHLPPESLAMEKHTYGVYSNYFSVIFNGTMINIQTGQGQFFDGESGMRRLINEMQEMKLFPKMFPVSLSQNSVNGDVSYVIYMNINGVSHKVVLTYDRSHPEYQINAIIEYPRLNTSKMLGHWYSDGRPCYIHSWTRSWTALKVATQLRFWLEDYYNDSGYVRDYEYEMDRIMRESDRIINEINRKQSFWRFW